MGSPCRILRTSLPLLSQNMAEFILKEMTAKHRQAMSLLAQGVGRQTIAELCEWTPEYITMLARQPLCQEYIKGIAEFVDMRFQAMAEQTADVISDTLRTGSEKGKLSAAKLQLEVTHKIGPERTTPAQMGEEGRLEKLAERLVALLGEKQPGAVLEGEFQVDTAPVGALTNSSPARLSIPMLAESK